MCRWTSLNKMHRMLLFLYCNHDFSGGFLGVFGIKSWSKHSTRRDQVLYEEFYSKNDWKYSLFGVSIVPRRIFVYPGQKNGHFLELSKRNTKKVEEFFFIPLKNWHIFGATIEPRRIFFYECSKSSERILKFFRHYVCSRTYMRVS